eukprot:338108-Rhodomonas_salina.2
MPRPCAGLTHSSRAGLVADLENRLHRETSGPFHASARVLRACFSLGVVLHYAPDVDAYQCDVFVDVFWFEKLRLRCGVDASRVRLLPTCGCCGRIEEAPWVVTRGGRGA